MTPHDQQRFAKLITDFVEGCGFERPFHLVVIDARGTASVTRYGKDRLESLTRLRFAVADAEHRRFCLRRRLEPAHASPPRAE